MKMLLEEHFQLGAICVAVLVEVAAVAEMDMVDMIDVVDMVDIGDVLEVLTAVSLFISHAINFCISKRDIAVEYLMAQIEHSSGHAVLAA